jgi:large subunit ribosomal protein L4
VFGPHPRSYEQKLPRRCAAWRCARLSRQVRRRRDPRHRPLRHGRRAQAKAFAAILAALGAGDGHERRVLVVAPAKDELLVRSAANLPSVSVILADSLNVVDLLNADAVVIEQPALARMEEVYS